MKLLRWLRSRPLARVRRTLATQKRAARIDALYRQQDEIIAAIQRGTFRPTRNQREMFASKEDWKLL